MMGKRRVERALLFCEFSLDRKRRSEGTFPA